MAIKEIRFWNGGGVMSNVTRQKELETKEIGQYRKALLSNVNGRILELGIGKGTNLLYYPRSVHKIVGVDHSLKKLCRSIPETEHYYVDYNHLPFEDDSFDTVVVTFLFHQIVELEPVFSEIKRVLRTRGRLIFMDFGKAEGIFDNIVQNLLNPFCEIFIGNVINRDYFSLLKEQNFLLANQVKKNVMIPPKSAFGTLYMGVAINTEGK